MQEDFYGYSGILLDGKNYSFEQLRGKAVLVVNTASKCGFAPQYAELQQLHEELSEKGLVVLGFPSDDFLKQEFASNEEIATFCQLNYGVTFPVFQRSHVRGKEQNPLFRLLTNQERHSGAILWNFEKFLISPRGELLSRFRSNVKPSSQEVRDAIANALAML